MSVAVKMRHIESSPTKPGAILRFRSRTPARIIKHIEREYADYLINGDDELVDLSTTEWYKRMEKKMTPGKMLKTLREVREFSQARLGEMTGTPASRISDYETGQRAISKEVAKKLAAIFNVSPAVFI
jgi:antitoxin component HigA of HigAB toxin-antitoxin module